jgi:3-phenylpropionate/cinnamic acid dioxygenase small subunit
VSDATGAVEGGAVEGGGVEAVAALVHAYARLIDAGDLDGVARLFDRAVWRSPQHPEGLRGLEAVRRVYDGVRLYDGSPRTKHVISNLVVEVDEALGSASSRCCFTVLHGAEGRSVRPVLSGRYHDAFARGAGDAGAGGWHFTERVTHVDLVGDVSGHFRAERPLPPRRPAE